MISYTHHRCVCVMHLTEVKTLLLWLTCFLDMHTTSQSWSDSLTRVNGRMGSSQNKKKAGDWSGIQMGPRPINILVLGI
jgi:hypothetical protein